MDKQILSLNPTEFAAAYIQTLKDAKKRDEFSSDDEYRQHMEDRKEFYLVQYLDAISFAINHPLIKENIVED